MARDAGVTMNECRLLEENGRRHFMTKRFDRLPGGAAPARPVAVRTGAFRLQRPRRLCLRAGAARHPATRATDGGVVLLQAYVINIIHQLWGFTRVVRDIYQSYADAKEMVENLLLPHEIKDAPMAKELVVNKG